MDHQIGVRTVVMGRISTVRWLEAAPYFAKKVRGDKGYWNYVFDVADEEEAYQVALRLEGDDLGSYGSRANPRLGGSVTLRMRCRPQAVAAGEGWTVEVVS